MHRLTDAMHTAGRMYRHCETEMALFESCVVNSWAWFAAPNDGWSAPH